MNSPISSLPSALSSGGAIARRLESKQLAVFLDFDGTLAAIADRPEQARLSDAMRQIVHELADHCTVAVISGRDRPDVEAMVDLSNLIYAGSHGFDISGNGKFDTHEAGNGYETLIGEIGDRLDKQLDSIEGSLVERKKFSIAVHYRLVADERDADRVRKIIDDLMKDFPDLRLLAGKKIFDILPPVDWDKGQAILWLLATLDLAGPSVLPIYIGDDVTDEAAFQVLHGRGVGICVQGENNDRMTAAEFIVRDVDEVGEFLTLLIARANS